MCEKEFGGPGYYSRRIDCPPFDAPENPTSLPQTATLRAPAGVALGGFRPPLIHTITCVPAFGLSVGGVLHTAEKARRTQCWDCNGRLYVPILRGRSGVLPMDAR